MVNEYNSIKSLPARFITHANKVNDKLKMTYMDAFEQEALIQFEDNIRRFGDFYRMYNQELSTVSLKDFAPHIPKELVRILDKHGLPSNIHHYDLIGRVIKAFVGKLSDMEDKFVVTDVSELGKSDFLMNIEKSFMDVLRNMIQLSVQQAFLEQGINPNTQQQFQSEEEQQAFMQQMQQIEAEATPEALSKALKTSFKSVGVKWGEATLEKDEIEMDFKHIYAMCLKNFLLSGKCFTLEKIYEDRYKKYPLDSRQVFHSKESSIEFAQDFDYAGTLTYQTATEVIKNFSSTLTLKEIEKVLGGKDGKDAIINRDDDLYTTHSNFLKGQQFHREVVPYAGYRETQDLIELEDLFGVPLGETYYKNEHGELTSSPSFIPRGNGGMTVKYVNALEMEKRFTPDDELFQVTEVYFHMQELVGELRYRDEFGIEHFDTVTKEIDKEFIKKYEIKEYTNKSVSDFKNDPIEENYIVWHVRSRVWEGVKISGNSLTKPLYPYFRPMEVQITAENDFDSKLPITGILGDNVSANMYPYQQQFNVVMNEVVQLTEKELGTFFSVGLESLPTEVREEGEVEDILMTVRNMAKQIGLFPTISTPEELREGSSHKNMFGVHTVSHQNEIMMRLQLADKYEMMCYQAVGLNLPKELSDTKHTTAEGVKISNETMNNQIAHIFDYFNRFIKADKIHHLRVAQIAQVMGHDSSLFYTKDGASLQWLEFTHEHKIPLRKLGLTLSNDSSKKKQFLESKNFILNNNTLKTDIKSLIELASADNFTALLDRANEERSYAESQAQVMHQREMERVTAESEARKQEKQFEWQLIEESKKADRINKIQVELLESYGRMGDADAPEAIFDRADKMAKNMQAETKMNNDYELGVQKIQAQLANNQELKSQSERRLELEERKLDLKEKEIEAKREIAYANKN